MCVLFCFIILDKCQTSDNLSSGGVQTDFTAAKSLRVIVLYADELLHNMAARPHHTSAANPNFENKKSSKYATQFLFFRSFGCVNAINARTLPNKIHCIIFRLLNCQLFSQSGRLYWIIEQKHKAHSCERSLIVRQRHERQVSACVTQPHSTVQRVYTWQCLMHDA